MPIPRPDRRAPLSVALLLLLTLACSKETVDLRPALPAETVMAAPAAPPLSPALAEAAPDPAPATSATPVPASPAFNALPPGDGWKSFAGKRVRMGAPNAKKIALTLDDGPHPNTTPQVLEILQREQVPAVFFMLGRQVRDFPAVARMVADAGFELGNHSFSHANLRVASADRIKQEIDDTQRLIEQATGRRPDYFRAPRGLVGEALRAQCAADGLPIVAWSVDTEDWKPGANPERIMKIVGQQTGNGGIILMHDIQKSTIATLPTLIRTLREEGYTFVTLREILNDAALAGVAEPSGDILGGSPTDTPAAPATLPPAFREPATIPLSQTRK